MLEKIVHQFIARPADSKPFAYIYIHIASMYTSISWVLMRRGTERFRNDDLWICVVRASRSMIHSVEEEVR